MLFAVLFSVLGVADDYTNTITLNKVIYMLLIFIGVYIISKKKKTTT
jgi:uncharacterized membrane protein YfcA